MTSFFLFSDWKGFIIHFSLVCILIVHWWESTPSTCWIYLSRSMRWLGEVTRLISMMHDALSLLFLFLGLRVDRVGLISLFLSQDWFSIVIYLSDLSIAVIQHNILFLFKLIFSGSNASVPLLNCISRTIVYASILFVKLFRELWSYS